MTGETGDGSVLDDEASDDGRATGEDRDEETFTCDEAGCDRPAAVRLHIPWSDDRSVCPAHARVLARPDGVVAEPIEGTETEWP